MHNFNKNLSTNRPGSGLTHAVPVDYRVDWLRIHVVAALYLISVGAASAVVNGTTVTPLSTPEESWTPSSSVTLSRTTSVSQQVSTTQTEQSPVNAKRASSASVSSSMSVTESIRLHNYLGKCRVVLTAGTAEKRHVSISDLAGGSPNDAGALVSYFTITAVDFRAKGLSMHAALQNPERHNNTTLFVDGVPTFTPIVAAGDAISVPPLSSIFVLSVKDTLYTRMLGSADAVLSNILFHEGDSKEGHGVLSILQKNRAVVTTSANGNQTISIALVDFVSYRIASDEWLVINFFDNATRPFGCAAQGQLIVRITAYTFLELQVATNVICFVVLLAGLVASMVGAPLALSQHAGAVSLLSLLHFAQEDGAKLPLAINVFQASVGATKYRYVVGVLVVQTSVIAFLAIVHYLFARWIIPHVRGLNVYVAQASLRHPSLTVALVLHLAPGMWFAFGRNLGHQSAEQYVLNFCCFSLTSYLTWIGFRDLVSASMSVRYLPHKDRSGRLIDHGFHDDLINSIDVGGDVIVEHTVDDEGLPIRKEHPGSIALEAFVQSEESRFDASQHRPHRFLILREAFHHRWSSWFRRLLLWLDEEDGVWRSIDPLQTFLPSRGHAIFNYTKRGRLWMGFEQVDVFLVALLTLVDNYTPQLASIQFGITLAVKVLMFLAAVGLRPARRTYVGLLLLVLYFFEMCAALALVLSGLRAELVPVCQLVQTVVCFICSIVLALELLCVLLISTCTALLRVRRRQAFLSSAKGRDPVERFTTRVQLDALVEGVDLIDGVLVDSEMGRDCARRKRATSQFELQQKQQQQQLQQPHRRENSGSSPPPSPPLDKPQARNVDVDDAKRDPPMGLTIGAAHGVCDDDILMLVDGKRPTTTVGKGHRDERTFCQAGRSDLPDADHWHSLLDEPTDVTHDGMVTVPPDPSRRYVTRASGRGGQINVVDLLLKEDTDTACGE